MASSGVIQACDVDPSDAWPAEIEKKTKRYPTDLTDEEWARIEPFLPGAAKSGRPARTDLREVLNAIRYLARSGGGWRMLPKDFPPWPTVYWWFRRFVRRFLFQTIHDVALMLDRERVGREASPTGGVIDSQSVKAPEAKTSGYDAGKKIVGRKRHIAVDTDGRLLMVNLTTAHISDSAGAEAILDGIRKRWPWVKHLFADGAYDRLKLMDKAAYLDFVTRSSAGRTTRKASRFYRADGWSSEPSTGSPAGGVSCGTTKPELISRRPSSSTPWAETAMTVPLDS